MKTVELRSGDVVWAELSPALGREQSGRRPVVVVSGTFHLELADTLAMVVPITSVDRGWDNHVLLPNAGLDRPSWAMTEQVRTISRERIVGSAGWIGPRTLHEVRTWLTGFLDI